MVQRYITVSRDIERWLQDAVHISGHKIRQIYNGVDGVRFSPPRHGRAVLPADGFAPNDAIVIGSVGRMEAIKDQITLVKAFIELCEMLPDDARRLRLALIGEGSLLEPARTLLRKAGRESQAWLPGRRHDVAELLRGFDMFVLPSINEGISNTIIEAMATALPVVATRVGGNNELVMEGETGMLVPPQQPQAMARALCRYAVSPHLRAEHGNKGRRRVESQFTLRKMVENYLAVYDELLQRP
jgi:sugar transferase (PEP-CTERM/EpsH1 system associated)